MYLQDGEGSYSHIQRYVADRWGITVSKSLLNYYRGSGRKRAGQFVDRDILPCNWDWLVGFFYANGCKFKDQWKYVSVFTLSVSEKHILRKLLVILRAGGLDPRVYKKQNSNAIDIRVYNKGFYESLPLKSGIYTPKAPLAFIAGMFDGDGFIGNNGNSDRWIFSQAKCPKLVDQLHSILSRYGTSSIHLAKRSNWLPIYRVAVLKDGRVRLRRTAFTKYCVRVQTVASGIQNVVPRAGVS
jgi:intein/homing endonuclease